MTADATSAAPDRDQVADLVAELRDADDHEVAARVATVAGHHLLRLRERGADESWDAATLKDAGDREAHELIVAALRALRPGDAILSEEAADDRARLDAERAWIVDPLDGTREYGEPPRDDWAVHVALWQRDAGDLVVGAVAQAALGLTFATAGRGMPPVVPPRLDDAPARIVVSRSRPPSVVEAVRAGLSAAQPAELVPMGSAGAKVMAVVRGVADVYVHAGGQYEWDSAAPVAVARAAGLHTSRIDGSPLRYNQDDVRLPDLVVCRPELVDDVLEAIERAGSA